MNQTDIAMMRAIEADALRSAAHQRLVKTALTAQPQGVRYELGHALVRLGRWLEGQPMDHSVENERNRQN
jgi:hypothetical protein